MYEIRYNTQMIKSFDDRREALQYADDFFDSVDDNRRSNNVFVFELLKYNEEMLIYVAYRNISYK